MAASSASLSTRALRGTKRACPSCSVRFYDLGRDPVVCPACGTSYVPEADPMAALLSAEKPARRARSFKYPTVAAADPEPAEAAEPAAAEDAEEPAGAEADDDVILEQEPDDASVEDLIEHDITEDPKDR